MSLERYYEKHVALVAQREAETEQAAKTAAAHERCKRTLLRDLERDLGEDLATFSSAMKRAGRPGVQRWGLRRFWVLIDASFASFDGDRMVGEYRSGLGVTPKERLCWVYREQGMTVYTPHAEPDHYWEPTRADIVDALASVLAINHVKLC